MTRFDLPLGVIELTDFVIKRSGLRWLVRDHYPCRAGEVVAYCNVGLTARPRIWPSRMPFAEEARDFQVTLAPSVGGILHQAPGLSLGGYGPLVKVMLLTGARRSEVAEMKWPEVDLAAKVWRLPRAR